MQTKMLSRFLSVLLVLALTAGLVITVGVIVLGRFGL